MYETKEQRLKREAEKRAQKFTTVIDRPKETLRTFTDAFNKAEQEKIDAPKRALQAKIDASLGQINQTVREINKDIRAYWSQSLADMDPKKAVVDSIGEYTLGLPATPETKREVTKTVFDGLANLGITLIPEAEEKFGAFVATLVRRRGVEYSVANLVEALDRLINGLGVFVEGRDGTGLNKFEEPAAPQPTPAPVSEAAPTVDEVLAANSIESREGNKRITAAVELDVLGEWEATFNHYVTAVREQFGESMTQDELNSLGRIVVARNYNPASLYSWSQARVLGVRNGTIRPSFLTPDELLSWQVDKGEVPMNTFAERQAFQRKVAALNKGIPLLS